MRITKNANLSNLNSFRVQAKADYLIEIETVEDYSKLSSDKLITDNPVHFHGNGTNTLFTSDFHGVIIRSLLPTIKVLSETATLVKLEVDSGANWHDLVTFAVDHNWGGIENMALIPGTVGAAAVQNIAAYGQNVVDVFDHLVGVSLADGHQERFDKTNCRFAYRDSIFKNELQGQFFVTKVCLNLSKSHHLETSYFQIHITNTSLKEELAKVAKEPYCIRDVYNAICVIRNRKLPDYKLIPTAGSFFVNPTVEMSKLTSLQKHIRELQFYPVDQLSYKEQSDPVFDKANYVKIPAGRLLDELGWLGKWIGNVGVHDKHALIVVTNGKATGSEILDFTDQMRQSVKTAYDIDLQSEVCII